MIDSDEARAALDDIKDMVARVRQSNICDIASLVLKGFWMRWDES